MGFSQRDGKYIKAEYILLELDSVRPINNGFAVCCLSDGDNKFSFTWKHLVNDIFRDNKRVIIEREQMYGV